jgi:hypothetical protein
VKITTARYRKLVSGPGHDNKAVEAEAIVKSRETLFDWMIRRANRRHG